MFFLLCYNSCKNVKNVDKWYYENLYSEETPLVFSDGTEIYNRLKKTYKTHEKGYFIYGPSGVGKTYFVEHQKEKNWIDGDVLWSAAKAFPNTDWWNFSGEEIDAVERRTDVITEQAKKLGFWIIGASSVGVIPDAIVMPDLETHVKYIKYRENHNYDGGMKGDDLEKIKRNREYYLRFSGVPVFTSVCEAVSYLEHRLDK